MPAICSLSWTESTPTSVVPTKPRGGPASRCCLANRRAPLAAFSSTPPGASPTTPSRSSSSLRAAQGGAAPTGPSPPSWPMPSGTRLPRWGPASHYPTLPAAHDRVGRALQLDPSGGVGLRAPVSLGVRAADRAAGLARAPSSGDPARFSGRGHPSPPHTTAVGVEARKDRFRNSGGYGCSAGAGLPFHGCSSSGTGYG